MAMRRPEQYSMLLRVRKRQEDLSAMTLATARREVRNAEAQRDEFERLQRETLATAAERASGTVDPFQMRQFLQYQRHLAWLTVGKNAQIAGLNDEAENRRQALGESMKQRRVVERLMEHARDAVREKARRDEQRLDDETSSTRAALTRSTTNAARKHLELRNT